MTTDSSGRTSPTYPTDSGSDAGKTDVARDQAGQVVGSATDKASQVAQTTKEQAQEVISEATTQARNLTGELRSQANEQANTQLSRLVDTLRTVGDDLEQMLQGGGASDSGIVADLTSQLRTHVRDAVSFLDGKEPSDLLTEVQRYARRRPGAFLLGAAVAGVVAGRLTRGAKAAASDDGSMQTNGRWTGDIDPYATSVPPATYPLTTPTTAALGTTTYDEPVPSAYPATGTPAYTDGVTSARTDADYTGEDLLGTTSGDRTTAYDDPYGSTGSPQGPRP